MPHPPPCTCPHSLLLLDPGDDAAGGPGGWWGEEGSWEERVSAGLVGIDNVQTDAV